MTPRKTQPADAEKDTSLSPANPAVDWLRPRLAAASKEDLVALLERLACDSEELAARIDYITNPAAAATALQRQITGIRNGKRLIAYGESRHAAADLSGIVADIRTDVLPRDPEKAAALAEKVFCLDQKVFERADDSDGFIADELRAACVLWLDAAAALRVSWTDGANWAARVYGFYRQNDTEFANRCSSKRIACYGRMRCGASRVASRTTRDERWLLRTLAKSSTTRSSEHRLPWDS
jgi:hypothetical protein